MNRFSLLILLYFSGLISSCDNESNVHVTQLDDIIINDSILEDQVFKDDVITSETVTVDTIFRWASQNDKEAERLVVNNWNPSYISMVVELMYLSRNPDFADTGVEMLERQTGLKHGLNLDAWHQYIWDNPPGTDPLYSQFKARAYSLIDPSFEKYFDDQPEALIRLDEVRWGGVRRDGIPPLKDPKMISVDEATYMDDSNVVFGLEINGDARAYPKRILAWHEMFKDTVGGVSVNGVYCTLCGSMILYETEHEGKHYELGTSGFLYRSNKLMYDADTYSMWSTLDGKPVIGPLVNQGIELKPRYVVTTTWGRWKELHPETQVLSLDTGHRRNYGEGVAYKDYFATDEIMFNVPFQDDRLLNKDEVLALRFGKGNAKPKVISADFLFENKIYQSTYSDQDFAIFTDKSGANRIYDATGLEFEEYVNEMTVKDIEGTEWRITEAALVDEKGTEKERLPAHRAFWFGWYAAFPDTELIK